MEKELKAAEYAAPPTSRKLHIFGFVVTGAWIVGLLVYVVITREDLFGLAPNELGDFAAGAFAPLAFLWLVLGFFQQGEELRYSSEALWLQGRELQNSVEQQRELVNATREGIQQDVANFKHQQEEITRKSRPILKLTPGGSSGTTDGEIKYDFYITNHGRPCTDLNVAVEGHPNPLTSAKLDTGSKLEFRKRLHAGPIEPFGVTVTYLDERLLTGSQRFRVSRQEGPAFTIETGPDD